MALFVSSTPLRSKCKCTYVIASLLVWTLLSGLVTVHINALPTSRTLRPAGGDSTSTPAFTINSTAVLSSSSSCMMTWLELTPGIGIGPKAHRHEKAFKLFSPHVDESNAGTFNTFLLSVVLGSRATADNFLSCMTGQTELCRQAAPCQNGGKCLYETAALGGHYQCQCREGFTGRACGQEIPSCVSNPCQNGGVCMEVDGNGAAYRCNCPPLHTGAHCQTVWLSEEKVEYMSQAIANVGSQLKKLEQTIESAQITNSERLGTFLGQLQDQVSSNLNRSLSGVASKLSSLETRIGTNEISLAGEWELWSSWSGCSRTCGSGVRERSRRCKRGVCVTGDISETRTCILRHCGIPLGGRQMVYQGIKLRAFKLTSNADLSVATVGCQRYVPNKSWTKADFQAICERFRTGAADCVNIDMDLHGGRCTNYNAVLSFENVLANAPDVWVNAKTFSWDPATGSNDDCNLHTGISSRVVYACL